MCDILGEWTLGGMITKLADLHVQEFDPKGPHGPTAPRPHGPTAS
jgi:hypothetical protein